MATSTLDVPLSDLILDDRLRMRETISAEVVDEYLEAIDCLPEAKAVMGEGGMMWLTDGWHRHAAHVKGGKDKMKCAVREGTFLDALKEAAGANHGHGHRRTIGDKKRAVTALLGEKTWADRSDRMVADACHVSHTFVASIREVSANSSSQSESGEGDNSTGNDSSRNSGEKSTENEAKKRTGRDGKSRSATRKTSETKRAKKEPKTVVDANGKEVPSHARDEFADPWIQSAIDFLGVMDANIRGERLADGMHKRAKHYPFINGKDFIDGIAMIQATVEQVLNHLKDNRPAHVCPACEGKRCPKCRHRGVVPRSVFKELS